MEALSRRGFNGGLERIDMYISRPSIGAEFALFCRDAADAFGAPQPGECNAASAGWKAKGSGFRMESGRSPTWRPLNGLPCEGYRKAGFAESQGIVPFGRAFGARHPQYAACFPCPCVSHADLPCGRAPARAGAELRGMGVRLLLEVFARSKRGYDVGRDKVCDAVYLEVGHLLYDCRACEKILARGHH